MKLFPLGAIGGEDTLPEYRFDEVEEFALFEILHAASENGVNRVWITEDCECLVVQPKTCVGTLGQGEVQ